MEGVEVKLDKRRFRGRRENRQMKVEGWITKWMKTELKQQSSVSSVRLRSHTHKYDVTQRADSSK